MSLTLPEAAEEMLRQAHEKLASRYPFEVSTSQAQLILTEAVQQAHLIAMATAGQRIVTVNEIADHLGVNYETVRRRIRDADPPVEPVKYVNNVPLYTLDDIPRLALVHVNTLVESGATTQYIKKKTKDELRAAVRSIAKKPVQRRILREPRVRWADWGSEKPTTPTIVAPEKVVFELSQSMAAEIRAAIQADGVFKDLHHYLRALIQVALEQREEKQT